MLRISQSAIWGLFALNYLSKHSDRMVTAQEIADWGRLSRNSLVKILQNLRREGLVRAVRGDGFELARPPEKISVLDAVLASEGPLVLEEVCLMGRASCELSDTCPVSTFCHSARDFVRASLSDMTLDRLPADPEGRPICLKGR